MMGEPGCRLHMFGGQTHAFWFKLCLLIPQECFLGSGECLPICQPHAFPFQVCLVSLQEYFLGSGGVFGLLQALVGEVLPGSARCVAVGNALLQGPVVFHFPQYVVGRIKERAMEGDKDVMQLLVDLYR